VARSSYRNTLWGLSLFLCLTGALGISARFQGEVFPFFSWALYTTVPSDSRRGYRVIIYQCDGLEREHPAPARETPCIERHGTILRAVVHKLGASLDRGNSAESNKFRTMLEREHLRPPCRYAVERWSYDPLELATSGRVHRRVQLAEFTCAR
jgi:hypothetical protein